MRSGIYNKLRRCRDENKRQELFDKRDDCTAALIQLRKEKKIALTIIEDDPKIKENIRNETQARNEAYGLEKRKAYRSHGYER